jgi:EAL domain-containing protein (putative c-di-GMP-specific phosphodiesterase class I)
LKHRPFDYFQIDGDFIRGFGANTIDQLVVEAIVGIARGMGKKTVAEFVTVQAMTDRLRRVAAARVSGATPEIESPATKEQQQHDNDE